MKGENELILSFFPNNTNVNLFVPWFYRARRRKKLSKALERQARKLRAKGITVDLEALKAEYLSQHRINASDSEDDGEGDDDGDEDPIDVVGDDSCGENEPEDCSIQRRDSSDDGLDDAEGSDSHKNSTKPNPFSIDSLLYNSHHST